MADPLPLQIQRRGGHKERTLVLLHVAELQSQDSSATPDQVRRLFLSLRVPPPANINNNLSLLRHQQLVISLGSGRWAVTPAGLARLRDILAEADDKDLVSLGRATGEPTLAEAPHHLIPPELAPAPFQAGIARFLQGHPFDRNVLCITRFPRSDQDPVAAAISACREACADVSLSLHLASDRAVVDLLFGNVAAAMWACRYGIAVFEDQTGEGINYNVVFEVGAMLMTGRRCLLLKDESVAQLPTDLVGHIYQPVALHNGDDIAGAVHRWAREDLALG